jgi:oligopeptidase B
MAGMQTIQPPVPEKRAVRITQLGRARTDDYQWLKDDNWQKVLEDPALLKQDIADYLHAENAFHDCTMSCTEHLKDAIFQEMKGRTKEDVSSPPWRDGPFKYYYRFETGAEHGIHCRKSLEGDAEEILLDENAASVGKPFYNVGCTRHSPDHAHFAWCAPPRPPPRPPRPH